MSKTISLETKFNSNTGRVEYRVAKIGGAMIGTKYYDVIRKQWIGEATPTVASVMTTNMPQVARLHTSHAVDWWALAVAEEYMAVLRIQEA